MKILLIGEYSRFHNSLKEGLMTLGHQVTLVGTGDDFKKYPVDFSINPYWSTSKIGTLVRKIGHRFFKRDIALWETGWRFNTIKSQLKGYQVVQLINSWSIRANLAREKDFIDYLKKNNGTLFLSACGTDTPFVDALLKDPLPYHLLSPYLKNPLLANAYWPTLRYATDAYRSLYTYVFHRVERIIPTDLDYYLPLKGSQKVTELVPTPIQVSKIDYVQPRIDGTIIIFHGINQTNYFKKGNDIFEKALELVKAKFPDKVSVHTVRSLPYTDYMKAYTDAHIVLDQVYAHDQGYNALEAMARGKVVFTGAGTHFQEHYGLTETVAIDAIPDPEAIAKALEILITNPEKIMEISKNARNFVEKHHDHIRVAERYLSIWTS